MQLAMRETANLPPFTHLIKEWQVIHQDACVDDILTFHNITDELKTITANLEQILKAGGFELKPWVFSGQSGRKECSDEHEESRGKIMVLPNHMWDDNNESLGLGYIVEEDKLHVINFSKRKKKCILVKTFYGSKSEPRHQTL